MPPTHQPSTDADDTNDTPTPAPRVTRSRATATKEMKQKTKRAGKRRARHAHIDSDVMNNLKKNEEYDMQKIQEIAGVDIEQLDDEQLSIFLNKEPAKSERSFKHGHPFISKKALRKSSKTCQDLHAWCMEKMKAYPEVQNFQVEVGTRLGANITPIMIDFEDLFLVYNSSEIDMSIMRCYAL